LNLRASVVANTPHDRTTSTTQPVTRPSTFQQILGGAAQVAAIAAPFIPSDRRMKTDVEYIGDDPESGTKLYSYRYKGDPKSYPKVVGPMAQDIEREEPGRVIETTKGKKVVMSSRAAGLMQAMGA
jgi:hypothetical protein